MGLQIAGAQVRGRTKSDATGAGVLLENLQKPIGVIGGVSKHCARRREGCTVAGANGQLARVPEIK